MNHSLIARIKNIALILGAFVPLTAHVRAASGQDALVREVELIVEGGYQPAKIIVKAGERVRLKFVRKEYTGCTRELVIPALELRRELPPNKPVLVDLPALSPGEYEFRCGMNMVRGAITVVAS